MAVALDLCGLHGLAAAADLAVLLKQRHLHRAMATDGKLTNMALQTSTNIYKLICQYDANMMPNMMPICLV